MLDLLTNVGNSNYSLQIEMRRKEGINPEINLLSRCLQEKM